MAFPRKALVSMASSFLPDVGAAVCRFPLASVIALLFTLLHLFEAEKILDLNIYAWLRLSAGLIAAFFWSVSVCLYSERESVSLLRGRGVEAAGFAVIAALFSFHTLAALHPFLFVFAAAIMPGLAPYLVAGGTGLNAAFWQFNHRLWLGAALALVGAVLFSGGLSVIVETLELLFDLKFPRATHENIWTLGLGLVAPLNWLSLAPNEFAEEIDEGEQEEFTARAVAVMVKYILAPLLLVYTAILYAYALKIGLESVLPKGRLGPMILAYGAIGSLTILLAWPTRKVGGALVALFWRHWFWLTCAPLALLFLAAFKRIAQYGLTDERYLVVLAGLWLAALALWFLVPARPRDIRILPITLCAALLIASFGPWGAVGLSVRNQKAQLAELLEQHGRLNDGRVVLKAANDKLPSEAAKRAGSILRYLQRHDRLGVIADWFAGLKDTPFADAVRGDEMVRKVTQALGAPVRMVTLTEAEHVNFSASLPVAMTVSGFKRMIGPIQIGDRADKMSARIDDGIVFVKLSNGRELSFDIREEVRKLANSKRGGGKDQRISQPGSPLEIRIQTDSGEALLLVDSLWGRVSGDHMDIRNLRGWVLLGGNL